MFQHIACEAHEGKNTQSSSLGVLQSSAIIEAVNTHFFPLSYHDFVALTQRPGASL